jgi:hypothetical protein
MRKGFLLLVAGAAAAWPAAAQSRPVDRVGPPSAGPVATRRPHLDLSGAWTSGAGAEPTVPRVTVSPPCNYTPERWFIQQDGNRVRAWTSPAHRAQGIAVKDRSSPPAAVGRIDGVRLTMRLDTLRYVLRYHAASGHLRGTLNGKPFWAVPIDIVEPPGCIPPR